MIICNACSQFGLNYENSYLASPADYIEGNLSAKIWIIGLNPKTEPGIPFDPSYEDLRNFHFPN